jgi:peptidyl-prolyl cis-trans isomerase C
MINVTVRAMLSIALGMYFVGANMATAAEEANATLIEPRPDAAKVVVKQGDVEVTLGDVDTWMLDVPEKDRPGFIRDPERIEQMLFQMLVLKQANRDARASGLDKKWYVAGHMKMAAERTLARYQMETVRNAIKSPDFSELAKEKYAADSAQFREPDVATLVHLLITEGERGSDAAVKLIQKLHKRILKDPSKLQALVMEYSDDSSKGGNQGLLKDISLATLDPAFADAARRLKPGQISEPVKSQFGWHIIRLDAIKLGRQPEFDEIKTKIVADLEQEYIDKAFRAYVDELRQRPMDPNPEVLADLPFRYGGQPEAVAPATPAPAAPEAKQ